MSSRTCKECNESKAYFHLAVAEDGRSVFKSEDGLIWHGRVCGECTKKKIKEKSGKRELASLHCKECGVEFMQKEIKQLCCSRKCYQRNYRKAKTLQDGGN